MLVDIAEAPGVGASTCTPGYRYAYYTTTQQVWVGVETNLQDPSIALPNGPYSGHIVLYDAVVTSRTQCPWGQGICQVQGGVGVGAVGMAAPCNILPSTCSAVNDGYQRPYAESSDVNGYNVNYFNAVPVNCCPGTNYVSSDFTGQVDSNGNGLYTVWFNNNIGNAFTMLSAWLPNYNYGNALTTLETYAGTVPAGPCPVVADATVSGPTQLDLFGGAHWTGAWTAGGTAPTPDPPYYLTQAAYYTSFTAVGS